jgi:hypothetical protein
MWRSNNPRPGAEGKDQNGNWIDLPGNNLSIGTCDVDGDGKPGGATDFNPIAGEPCVLDGIAYPLAHPRAGIVTVLAYAIGEESFNDANANGVYDQNEFFIDLPEVFLDHNADGEFCGRLLDGSNSPGAADDINCVPGGQFEEFVDYNRDGTLNPADGKFNGILCSDPESSFCDQSLTHVRASAEIIMSGSTPHYVVYQGNTKVTSVDLTSGNQSVTVFISDLNNNPMPDGTTIDFTATNGQLKGATSFTLARSGNKAHSQGITISQEKLGSGNESFDGELQAVITTPNGSKTAVTLLNVIDDR